MTMYPLGWKERQEVKFGWNISPTRICRHADHMSGEIGRLKTDDSNSTRSIGSERSNIVVQEEPVKVDRNSLMTLRIEQIAYITEYPYINIYIIYNSTMSH